MTIHLCLFSIEKEKKERFAFFTSGFRDENSGVPERLVSNSCYAHRDGM